MHYHAEYENHKLVHRYNQALLGEHHEWWKYTDDFRKCTYKNSLKDGTTDYEYDSPGNKTYEQSYLGEKFYEYDDSDNLISKKTIYEDGKTLKRFYVVATTKLKADRIIVKNIIHNFCNMEIIQNDLELIEQAIDY